VVIALCRPIANHECRVSQNKTQHVDSGMLSAMNLFFESNKKINKGEKCG